MNYTFKVLLEHNNHSTAVEEMYLMTHYYFRSAQDFTPRNTPGNYTEFRSRFPRSALHPPTSANDV